MAKTTTTKSNSQSRTTAHPTPPVRQGGNGGQCNGGNETRSAGPSGSPEK